MRKIDIRFIATSAIVAALYVALTWLLAPISYGSIQFRISEILILLVFFNPKYALPIVLGTFISNTTSSLGWYDMVFGTAATLLFGGVAANKNATVGDYLNALHEIQNRVRQKYQMLNLE